MCLDNFSLWQKNLFLLDGDEAGKRAKNKLTETFENYITVKTLDRDQTFENLFHVPEVNELIQNNDHFSPLKTNPSSDEKKNIKGFIKLLATHPERKIIVAQMPKTQKNIQTIITDLTR